MSGRRLPILAAAAIAVAASLPSSAAAATTFGNSCTATATAANVTIVMSGKAPANPLPIAAPASGVITKATFALPPVPTPIPQTVKTFQGAGPGQFKVVGKSDLIQVAGGTNSYDVRLPVAAGDLIGIHSTIGTLVCVTPSAADVISFAPGDAAVGSTGPYAAVPNRAIPLVATIEPDGDGDGYGDETQDKCPQSAQLQDECPVVVIDAFAVPEKKSLTVLVSADNEGSVTVTGSVKTKKSKKGGKGKRKGGKITLTGGTQTVKPGQIARFKVKYPKPLRKALAKSNKPLKATLTATATDVAGRITTDTAKAKLPGG